jgi:hypothetical protein
MYLILREDLVYKYIQGGHAIAQYALEYPEWFKDWNNQYLICLSVFNGQALKEIAIKFVQHNQNLEKPFLDFSKFIEPDLESLLPTALCFYDPDERFKHLVKDLNLSTK